MRVHYALTLVILALSGCGHGLDEAVASLDKGVGGYEGPVTPLSRPYLLRVEEGPDPPYRYTKISDLSGSTERTSMVIRTKIWAKGEERRVWTRVDERTVGSRTFRHDGAPLVLADVTSSSRGRIETIDLDFPALRLADVEIPEEASEAYQNWIKTFRTLNFEWPEEPVEMNSEIFSPSHAEAWFEVPSKGDGSKEAANPLKSILRNTMSIKIIGETYDDGVHCLVGVHSGTLVAEMKISLFTMKMRGHVLIDPQYGTLRRSAFVIEGVSERANGHFKSTTYVEMKPEKQDPGEL